MSNIPEDCLYTKQHEWIREADGLLWIGITDFAQNSLGDVVYVDLKDADTELAAEDPFGAIESVKAAEDLYAPLSGSIAEINVTLNDNPAAVNSDPYGSWMVKLKDFNKDDLGSLLKPAAYKELVDSLEEN